MRTTVWVFIGFPFPLFNKNTLLTEALGFSKILLVMFFVFVFSTPSPATHSPFVLFSSFTHFSFPHYLCSPQFSHILHSPCFPLPLSHTHTHTVHSLVVNLVSSSVTSCLPGRVCMNAASQNTTNWTTACGGDTEKDNVPVLLDTLLYPLLPSSALYYSSHKGEEEGMPLFYSYWNVLSEACREVLTRQHIL